MSTPRPSRQFDLADVAVGARVQVTHLHPTHPDLAVTVVAHCDPDVVVARSDDVTIALHPGTRVAFL